MGSLLGGRKGSGKFRSPGFMLLRHSQGETEFSFAPVTPSMNLELQDKVVLISGGAKGIGAAITRAFAAEGAVVCVLGRNPEEAARLAADLGGCVDFYSCEMTDET